MTSDEGHPRFAEDQGSIDPELFSRVVSLLRMQEVEDSARAERTELMEVTRELEQFSERHPESVPALRLLAECAQRLGDLRAARRHISRAELLDPWNVEILIISESLHEAEASLPHREGEPVRFGARINAGVISAETLLERAMGLFRLGELERAYSLAKLSFSINPQATHHLMDVLAAGSIFDPERLRKELMQLEGEMDPPAYLYLALGSACNVIGRYEEAVAWLSKGQELGPEEPYVLAMLHNEMAYVLAKQGLHLDRCLALARAALETFPDRSANGFIRDTLGVVYLKTGDVPKAIQNLREAVSKDPTVIPRFHLALALIHARDGASALVELRHISAARPSLESPHVEEIAILERVQSHIVKLEELLNLGGADDIRDALRLLDGLV
jgi:tetratricopeptide (TPR) repeat protein